MRLQNKHSFFSELLWFFSATKAQQNSFFSVLIRFFGFFSFVSLFYFVLPSPITGLSITFLSCLQVYYFKFTHTETFALEMLSWVNKIQNENWDNRKERHHTLHNQFRLWFCSWLVCTINASWLKYKKSTCPRRIPSDSLCFRLK